MPEHRPACAEAAERLAFSVEEALAATTLGRTAFYQLVNDGRIRTVKAGGRRLVPRSALVEFLNGGPDAAA